MADDQPVGMQGHCTCGSVRYRLKARPMFVHCCHCTWCQRETGSAFVVNALIEASNVELTRGAVQRTTLPTASGRGQVFCRCPDCGVTLWSHYAGFGESVCFLRVGTLDDPSSVEPDIHIYTSTKQPWVALPPGVPAVNAYYQRSAYWPADSVARLNALRGG